MVTTCYGKFNLLKQFQSTYKLAFKVDEDEDGGLRGLAEILLGYGERHFDGVPGQQGSRRGVWAGVLIMCGQFERVSPSEIMLQFLINVLSKGCFISVGASRFRN